MGWTEGSFNQNFDETRKSESHEEFLSSVFCGFKLPLETGKTAMRYELKLAIRKSGISQWRTAAKAEISETVLRNIVSGARDPEPSTAKRLSEILNVPVDQLFPEDSIMTWFG